MTKIFYSSSFVVAAHSFDTTRKAKWVADSLLSAPIAGLTVAEPASLAEEALLEVHAREYVRAVKTGEPAALAGSQGFAWDAGLWTAVCASNGGTVAAAIAALRDGCAGALASGLHHARGDRGNGFCTFNGLALAAKAALGAGAKRVLILDLDAHCGGGTHSLIAADPRLAQVDVSVDSFDAYVPRDGNTLDLVQDGASYLPAIRQRLDAMPGTFDLCLYNAGMDPFEGCAVGGMEGITREMLEEREALVFDWAKRRGMPIAFVLAGGYLGPRLDEAGLVGLHRLTLEAAAR